VPHRTARPSRLVALISALAASAALISAAPAAASPAVAYVGAIHTCPGGGPPAPCPPAAAIDEYGLDDAAGLTPLSPAGVGTGAGVYAECAPPSGRVVYSVDQGARDVRAFAVGGDGQLTPIGTPQAAGQAPQACAVTPDGRYLIVADDNAPVGQMFVFQVGQDGTLTPAPSSPTAVGPDPLALAVSPDGTNLYVISSSDSLVERYSVAADGSLTPGDEGPVATGQTPTAAIASPDGTNVYISALDGSIDGYRIAGGGALSLTGFVSNLRTPRGLAMSGDGHYLYVAEDGDAGAFARDATNGGLTPLTPLPCGCGPQGFNLALSPSGRSVYMTTGSAVRQYAVGGDGVPSLLTPSSVATTGFATGILALPDGGPTAAFTVGAARAGVPTAFDGTPSSGAQPLSYAWGFGDGTANGGGAAPGHTYATAGTYTVALTVTDGNGCGATQTFTGTAALCGGSPTATTTRTVTVTDSPPDTGTVASGGGTSGSGGGGSPGPPVPPPVGRRPTTRPKLGKCTSARRLRLRIRHPRGARVAAIKVLVAGGRQSIQRGGNLTVAHIDLRRLRAGSYRVRVVATLVRNGHRSRVTLRRVYRTCARRRTPRPHGRGRR